MNLANDPNEFCADAFALHRFAGLLIVIKHSLEGFSVATGVGFICLGHQAGAALAVDVIFCEVGMDALRDLAKEALKVSEGW